MPLSKYILNTVKGFEFNLLVFRESEWLPEVRTRLINESIELIDELILDPVFNYTLAFAYASEIKDTPEIQAIIAGGELLIQFLENEKFLMEASGLEKEYIDFFINEIQQIVSSGLQGLVSPEKVFKSLISLKFRLLEVRDQKQIPGWEDAARLLSYGFGGAALIILNASGLATSLGMLGPPALLSSALGAVFLDRSFNEALDRLKPKE